MAEYTFSSLLPALNDTSSGYNPKVNTIPEILLGSVLEI